LHKILVVDDIVWIRKGLIALLSKKFDFVYTQAQNGQEALAQVEADKPDIIITDVKMPGMDGIELLRQLREKDYQLPVIIISGHGEFEYAQSALKMGAVGYILKPVSEEMIFRDVERAIAQLENRRLFTSVQEQNEHLKQQQHERELKTALGEFLVKDKTAGKAILDEWLTERPRRFFTLLLVKINQDFGSGTVFEPEDAELIKLSVANIAGDVAQNIQSIWFDHPEQPLLQMALLSSERAEDLAFAKERIAKAVVETARESLQVTVTVGTGAVCDGLSHELYRQARGALNKSLLQGAGDTYRYTPLSDQTAPMPDFSAPLLETYLARRDLEGLGGYLRSLLLSGQNNHGYAYVFYLSSQILDILTREFGISVYEIAKIKTLNDEYLSKFDTMEQVIEELCECAGRVFQAFGQKDTSQQSTALRVKEYIDENYAEELSVKGLSAKFGLSYAHLSSVFKQQCDTGIVQYITTVRMNQAAKMLADTTADIAAISEAVGYVDTQYFYRVFKKHFGETPLIYRSRQKSKGG